MKRLLCTYIFLPFALLCISCDSAKNTPRKTVPPQAETQALSTPERRPLRLCFAGDIMAHTVNFRMDDYSLIYRDIQNLLKNCDLAFANMETPVCNDLPYETYPTFNVHTEYAQAAIDAGFNVFSLANNHTNDQGIKGIRGSAEFFENARSLRTYNAGIKMPQSDAISFDIIEVQGWKILFAAITEIVNANAHTDLFDFYPVAEAATQRLKEALINLRAEHPCDLFVLSIHSSDPEYVLEVTQKRRERFYDLLDTGVDIIWANHAHVSKPWEKLHGGTTEDGAPMSDKLIMYGMGNTISGQLPRFNFENPGAIREYTGTGIILQADLEDRSEAEKSSFRFTDIKPHIIITHIDGERNFIIKNLTEDFIAAQEEKTAAYYKKRLELMKEIREINTCR